MNTEPIVIATNLSYRQWKVNVLLSRYLDNNRVALMLYDSNDGELIATCTVNMPRVAVRDGYVLIKDWSENTGMFEWMQDHHLIGAFESYVPAGHVVAILAPLSGKVLAHLQSTNP